MGGVNTQTCALTKELWLRELLLVLAVVLLHWFQKSFRPPFFHENQCPEYWNL